MSNPTTDGSAIATDPLFDLAPVSLWLDDFNAVYELLQSWRTAGVTDIGKYLAERPVGIAEYFSCIKVLKVNQRTLDLYGARDVGELLAAGDAVFDNSDTSAAIAEISKLWNGETSYQTETINYTLDRRALNIRLNVNRLESVARPWDRMLMALEDFTEQKRAHYAVAGGDRRGK